MQEGRNVGEESEMRAEERERWKKESSKLSHERLQTAPQFPAAAHSHGQQEPSRGEGPPLPLSSALASWVIGMALPAWCLSSPICKMGLWTVGSRRSLN